MARPLAILQSEFPYNISARCINRDWFQIPMDEVWAILCDELSSAHKDLNLKIHSFVLMSNHFHLIASTPDSNISTCMHQFMGRSSRRLSRAGNRINETFAGRHRKTILQQYNYLLNAYKYNYRNPVKAGICKKVEDYEFSSIRFSLAKAKPLIPLVEDHELTHNRAGILRWLNETPDPEKLLAFQKGLRFQYFESPKHIVTREPLIRASDLL